MNWKDIKTSNENTHFVLNDKPVFDKQFIEVLKFHEPGIAPVKDETGSYHITVLGNELYKERYDRTFGFYCKRAAVIDNDRWFHIDEFGKRSYSDSFDWTGNFQENICAVRDSQNNYFHIDLNGNRCYKENYIYAGDFKDGIACVKDEGGFFRHIDNQGCFINNNRFIDLGIFHKNYATAKDEKGWFHIDKSGLQLYQERYELIEPFYNGFALVTKEHNKKQIINEEGKIILELR